MKRVVFIICLLFCAAFASAQDDKKWDVANPEGNWNFKEIKFTTDEGTWMNLDVSADGNQIVLI